MVGVFDASEQKAFGGLRLSQPEVIEALKQGRVQRHFIFDLGLDRLDHQPATALNSLDLLLDGTVGMSTGPPFVQIYMLPASPTIARRRGPK
ncbi:MAG: hypothetical protein JO166_24950 [Deltaproteobacteria bacterium]|nr:hypothetical protein [Deltaproteobacteria bacterium]